MLVKIGQIDGFNTIVNSLISSFVVGSYLPLTGGTLTGNLTAPTFIGALQGNATTATTLQTARTIALSGAATGTATSFNGSANISISVTGLNASNLNAGTVPTARLGSGTASSSTVLYGNNTWGAIPAAVDTITRLRGTTSGTLVSGDITLLAGSNTTITQSGNNITIASTNTNTTYAAGTGITLSGTTFSHTAHTGDVTGSTALTIANNVVTFAKIQNIATQRLLGRGAAGSGNIEELTLGTGLALSTTGVLSATGSGGTVTSITAGNGMNFTTISGTGTVTLGTPGDITLSSTSSVTSTSHTHALDSATTTAINNGNTAFGWGNHSGLYALVGRSIIAGNGLSGGGTLAANRTITLGTPTAIGLSTTNVVTTTSHTHALDSATTTAINNGNTAFGWGDFRDYGLGTGANVISDFDNQTQGSMGYTTQATLNQPSGLGYGSLFRFGSTSSFTQLFGEYTQSNRLFFRHNRNGVYYPLVEIYHTGNFSPSDYALVSQLPTVNNGALTLSTGTGLSGSATFTANQSGTSSFSVGIASTHKLPTTAEWAAALVDTTYSAGTGLSLSGTTFGQAITTSGSGTYVQSITQTASGFQVNLGTPPNTNTTYSNMAIAELNTGTVTSGRVISASVLNQWLNAKGFSTQTLTAGTNITISGSTISATNTNTTYSAGTGLTLTGTVFSLPVAISGSGNYVADVSASATGLSVTKGTLPVSSLVTATTATGVSNAATTNTNTFLNIVQGGSSIGSSTQITGTGSVTVTSDAAGKLTINGTNTNTTYTGSTSIILSGTSFQRAALTGDVTSAQNSNATTIATNAVTFTKMQNIATQRILGRGATGTGNVQELTLGTGLSLSTTGVLSATGSGGTVSSVGLTIAGNALNTNLATITSSGTFGLTWTGTSAQYVNGQGNLVTFPSIPSVSNLVPYTGANQNVNLNNNSLSNVSTLRVNNINTNEFYIGNNSAYLIGRSSLVDDSSPNNRNPLVLSYHTGITLASHDYYGGVRIRHQRTTSPYEHDGSLIAEFMKSKVTLDAPVNIKGLLTLESALNWTSGEGILQYNSSNRIRITSTQMVLSGYQVGDSTAIFFRPQADNSNVNQWELKGTGRFLAQGANTGFEKVGNAYGIANNVYQNWLGNASTTGIISIKFPQVSTSATMFDVTMKLFAYNNRYHGEYRVTFYRMSNNVIHATTGKSGTFYGSSGFPQNGKVVNVGIDSSGRVCINLGTTSTVWGTYVGFEVTRVAMSHSGYAQTWSSGWTHGIETSVAGYLDAPHSISLDLLGSIPSLVTATSAAGVSNVATTNTNTYLNIVEGGASVGSSTQITGTGSVTVTSDAAGKLTINGTNTNTTYSGSTSIILSGTSFQRAALTGDVTASQNSNATTIAANAVTFTKMQNIATQKLLGRSTTGTGNIEEITLGTGLTLTGGVLSAAGAGSISQATATVLGGVKLFSNTVQTVAATAVSATASRTYGIQLNSSGQAVVNVPWSNTTYSSGTLTVLNAGTNSTSRVWGASILSNWLDGKGYLKSIRINGGPMVYTNGAEGNMRIFTNNNSGVFYADAVSGGTDIYFNMEDSRRYNFQDGEKNVDYVYEASIVDPMVVPLLNGYHIYVALYWDRRDEWHDPFNVAEDFLLDTYGVLTEEHIDKGIVPIRGNVRLPGAPMYPYLCVFYTMANGYFEVASIEFAPIASICAYKLNGFQYGVIILATYRSHHGSLFVDPKVF